MGEIALVLILGSISALFFMMGVVLFSYDYWVMGFFVGMLSVFFGLCAAVVNQ